MNKLPLNIILKRLEEATKEAQMLGYVHMPIMVSIMDLFEGGHIAPIYVEDIQEASKKFTLSTPYTETKKAT